MDLGISGRRAAVAAASAGLGLACARALAAEGVRVALCGRDADRIEAASSSIRAAGGDAVGLVADVSSTEGAAGFVDRADEALGGIDILVANAGGPPSGTFASTDVDAYLPALELNLLSTVAMCKAAVPAMAARGWGRVVAITSMTVRQPSATLILSNTARVGDPDDFGAAVAFLCSEHARFIAGTALSIDGGAYQGLMCSLCQHSRAIR